MLDPKFDFYIRVCVCARVRVCAHMYTHTYYSICMSLEKNFKELVCPSTAGSEDQTWVVRLG